MDEVGFVTSVRDFLIHLDGLPTIRINDLVASSSGVRGFVNGILEDKVEVLLLDEGIIKPGEQFKRLEDRLEVFVGEFLLGRAINSFTTPIDGKGLLSKTNTAQKAVIDKLATGIPSRQFINKQFETGISVIDTLIPVGKGQRELVMGDARSGKEEFLLDLIVNQKGKNVVCVYACIGKPILKVRSLIDSLAVNGALPYTTIVAAASSDPAPLIYLAPYTAMTIAEHFKDRGMDVLLILDDLGTHAKIYREISLLAGRAPGRESYPGDIFYQHAHLLERAGNFNPSAGNGSITAFPSIEIDLNDFTSFIPTNLMAMTDGHILFRSSLYQSGQRPAIDLSLSVTRIGSQTQNRIQNHLQTKIKRILAQATEVETISRFSSELPEATQLILKQRSWFMELLKQQPFTAYSLAAQTAVLGLVFTSFTKDKEAAMIIPLRDKLYQLFSTDKNLATLANQLMLLKEVEELIAGLEKAVPEINRLLGINKVIPTAAEGSKTT